jgi:hypothetical protein
VRYTIVAAFALFIAPATCFAWGVEGHQIVAHIAARELTGAASAQLQDLLGGDAEAAMVQVSTWADEVRRARPDTAPWHFVVDIPVGSAGYDAGRDCRNDDCIVAQIEREKTILANRQLTPTMRAEALRFLIHFVGDVHQPLHAADNHDRGGNGIRVSIDGKQTNLHAIWDTEAVTVLGTDAHTLADTLEAQVSSADRKQWQSESTRDWANESFQVASTEIYAKLMGSGDTKAPIMFPNTYAASERTVVITQLEKAGVRLAWILNEVLQ